MIITLKNGVMAAENGSFAKGNRLGIKKSKIIVAVFLSFQYFSVLLFFTGFKIN